jgi:hypothetical protein
MKKIRKIIMYVRLQERFWVIPDYYFQKNVNVIVKNFDWVLKLCFLFIVIEICKQK